jgi:hypothetical protein
MQATDAVDPSPAVECNPPSGSAFVAGSTLVTCAATDRSGNSAAGSFSVVVRGPAEQLTGLRLLLKTANLDTAFAALLQGRLARAEHNLTNPASACRQLSAFTTAVFAELGSRNSSIDGDTAAGFLDALTVEQALGCLTSDSPFPPAAHDVVSLVEVINGLGLTGQWVRELKTSACRLGIDVVAGDVPAAAQGLGGTDGAIRAETAKGKLGAVQAAQLHALVVQIGADLAL